MRKKHLGVYFLVMALMIVTVISSCAVEDFHEHENDFNVGIKESKINFEEFKQFSRAFNLVTDINRNK